MGITVVQVAFEGGWPRVIEINNRNADGPLGEPELHRNLNRLGTDEWEAAGVQREYFILKRPKIQ